ncbi:MAG: AAA family ATPase [Gammaproteobacteria bacterium]
MTGVLAKANRDIDRAEEIGSRLDARAAAELGKSVPTATHARAVTRRLSDIQREALTWLWPGRIPLGKVSMLVGDPGLGKSLVTLGVAATVSRGGRWPIRGEGEAPAGEVVLISGEDDPADTIRPRLEAAAADLNRVHVLDGIADTDERGEPIRRPWTLNDLPELDRFLTRVSACKLIVIDPVSAYLAGTDSHKNSDIRALLAPLGDLAARHKLAVLAVSHLNKSQGPAIYRTSGSLAFTAAARAVYCVTKDANDAARRILVPIKANLAPDATGLAYRIGTDATGTPRLEWEPDAFAVDANEALSTVTADPEERSERTEAAEWLRDVLADGSKRASEIFKEAACSFSKRTLQRARNDIGARVQREGFGGGSRWYIPAKAPQSQNLGTNGGLGTNGLNSGFQGADNNHPRHSCQAHETGTHGTDEDGLSPGLELEQNPETEALEGEL